MKKALSFLKKNIQSSMTLEEMINVFEEMSKLPIKTDDDTLLLDTCYYDPTFSGKIVHIFFFSKTSTGFKRRILSVAFGDNT